MRKERGAIRAGIPCNLCEGRDATLLSRLSRTGDPLQTLVCIGCGLVWSDPRPHDPRKFYEDDYRVVYKQTFEPRAKHVIRAGKVALSRMNRIKDHLRGRMRILDVGSGGGEFAYLLKTLGHEVEGVEPNLGYANFATNEYGLRIQRGFIDEASLPEGGFDLITIWHVLEHTEDPGAVLRRLRRALRPGGLLVVEVPNVEATCQSPRNTFHEAHLYCFNIATLTRLAAKSGFGTNTIQLSGDGGNIIATFFPETQGSESVSKGLAIPDNHDRVVDVVRGHTSISHWLSVHPYRRTAGRLARMVTEWFESRHASSSRDRLDDLYARALQTVQDRKVKRADRKRTTWQMIVGLYVLAVVLEELFLDRIIPMEGWSDNELLGFFVAVQIAIVAGVVWVGTRPTTSRQFLRLAAWAGPLLALPAYC